MLPYFMLFHLLLPVSSSTEFLFCVFRLCKLIHDLRYFMSFYLLFPVLVQFLLLQNSCFACFVCVNEFTTCTVTELSSGI